MLRAIFAAFRAAPVFWYYIFKDFGKYIKEKGWTRFNYWGLHLFIGMFGGGKTISAVRRAYNICKSHKGVTVLTNLTLYGFPEDTRIIKLVNSSQILELPDKSIVLIDEIGSIFNSRDFASSKKSVPKPVYQLILQCRHRRIMLLGTVQRWNLLDKQLRDIADTLTVCHSYFADPFARYTTCAEYDAQEYDKWFNNPLLPLRCCHYGSSCITAMFRLTSCGVSMILLRWLIPCLIRNTYQMRRSLLTEPEPDSLPILSAIRKRSADLAGSVRFYPVPTVSGF